MYEVNTKAGWDSDPETAILEVLNFSGGKQSTALLWMVLRGEIEVDPARFVVLNADPGMENSQTYEVVRFMFRECERAGLEAFTVDGPNLYEDLLALRPGDSRSDNPAYFVAKPEGKRGQLPQKCTREYKIRPMDRAVRSVLSRRFGISEGSSHIPGFVDKWIGFTATEASRIKPPSVNYQRFRYPLIEMGLSNDDVVQYFKDNSLPVPPRSVCNACFANGLNTLREMRRNRPADWAQAVAVDRAVRNGLPAVKYEVFVSDTLRPLEELAESEFDIGDDTDDYACDSGYCFL